MNNVTKIIAFICLIPLLCCQKIGPKAEKPYFLQIKMKETDCMKCINGQLLLKDFADVAEVELVFNGLSDNEINRFLEVNSMEYLKNTAGCNFVSDKNTFNDINSNHLFSEGYLYDRQGRRLMRFDFRLDEPAMRHLRTVIKTGKYLMRDGCEVKIDNDYANSPVTFSFQNGKISILNSSMNVVQVFDMDGSLLYEVDGTKLDVLDIFKEMSPTESAQLTAINYLRDNGMMRPVPTNAFVSGETVLAGFQMPYLEMDSGQFKLRSYYTLLSFIHEDGRQSCEVVCNGRDEKIIKMAFDNEDNGLSAIIIKRDDSGDSYSIAFDRFSLSNGMLSVMYTKPIDYPDFERQPHYGYEPRIKCGLLNLSGTDFFYDVRSDSVIRLPFQCNIKVNRNIDDGFVVDYDTFLADWHSDDTEIGIIIKDNKSGKWYYELLSMKGEVVEKTELSPEESNIRQYYMTSPRTALCLTDENTIRTCVLGNFSECR